MYAIDDIEKRFRTEFGAISEKFKMSKSLLTDVLAPDRTPIAQPGVYVFWKDAAVIKIGRHFVNCEKRALEHIRDNTAGTMSRLKDDGGVNLILFTVSQQKDIHWVAALEIFFEQSLEPSISSKRLG